MFDFCEIMDRLSFFLLFKQLGKFIGEMFKCSFLFKVQVNAVLCSEFVTHQENVLLTKIFKLYKIHF